MKNGSEPIERGLPTPVVNLIHEGRGHLSAIQRSAGAERFLARIQERRALPAWMVWTVLAAASGSAVVALVGTALHRATRPLELAISGAHVATGGVIESDERQEPRLHFSDGSDIRLSAAAHAVLRHVDDSGVTVSVSDGDAEVDITHRPRAHWVFEAGPFVIHVTGTAFRFGWNAETEEFNLRMRRGSVEVTGPLTDRTLVLHAGEHLVAHVRQGEVVIHEHEAEDAPGSATGAPANDTAPHGQAELEQAPAGAISPDVAALPHATARGSVRASAPRRLEAGEGEPWPTLVARGAFEAVVADARQRGLETVLAREGAPELTALADAARYTRDDEVARRTLLAERHRFPGSTAACEAGFLLGRLAETRNDSAAAVEWFRRYVSEDPEGRYVAEALGRRMVLMAAVSADDARPVAEEYLRRFPSAAYASQAHAIANVP